MLLHKLGVALMIFVRFFSLIFPSTRALKGAVDGKLDWILNRKIARKSLGQPRVYATTCDESEIILAYFLLLFTINDFRAISHANVTKILVYMSPKGSCTRGLLCEIRGICTENPKECDVFTT